MAKLLQLASSSVTLRSLFMHQNSRSIVPCGKRPSCTCLRLCYTKTKAAYSHPTAKVAKASKGPHVLADPRAMQFERLIGTIELVQKVRAREEAHTFQSKNIPVADSSRITSTPMTKHGTNSARSIKEHPPAAEKFKPVEKPYLVTGAKTNVSKKKAKLTAAGINSDRLMMKVPAGQKKQGIVPALSQLTDNVGQFHKKLHIEHREKGTIRFSRANVDSCSELLSEDELHILSELARAASLPEHVRVSLQDFLNRQTLCTDVTEAETNHKKHSEPQVDYNVAGKAKPGMVNITDSRKQLLNGTIDPSKLREAIDQASKLLHRSKQKTLEAAVENERRAKESSFHANMAAFVELCIGTGMQTLAQSVLTSCYLQGRHKPKGYQRRTRAVRDIEIYNRLMHSWAKQGNVDAVRKLFLQIRDLSLKPTFMSFAIHLLAIGNQSNRSADAVNGVLHEISQAKFDLKEIFNECMFTEEDCVSILKAIHVVRPLFAPAVSKDQSGYSCSLLMSINDSNKVMVNPYVGVLAEQDVEHLLQRQLNAERADHIIIDSVMPQPEITPAVITARQRLEVDKNKWREILKRSFLTNRQILRANTSVFPTGHSEVSILPYLKLWNADVYVDLMLQEVDILGQDMALYSPSCAILHHKLGQKVFHKYIVQKRHQNYVSKVMNVYRRYTKIFCTDSELSANHRQIWTSLISEMKLENIMQADSDHWPQAVSKAVGKFMYDIILSEVKVQVPTARKSEKAKGSKMAAKDKVVLDDDPAIPAFYTVYRMRNGVMAEEILPHPFLVRLYEEAHLRQLAFEPVDMPSLVPPIPFFRHNCGGNMLNTTSLIRHPTQTAVQYKMVSEMPSQSLYPMFDGLNTVSACPWRVNKPLLDLIIQIFVSGGNAKLDIPEAVNRNAELPRITSDMSSEEKLKILKEKKMIVKERQEGYSDWCTELYRLSIANKYRDDIFWFPHSMDFRGRIYPTPAHFNHFGSDMARSILMFAKGKPLGPDGLNWLKIHLINLTGFKKRRPNKERLEYADSLIPEILDSADNPFTGRKWWQTSDEPWQTLACCMEIANALRSPNTEQFISHIPVHQDGSCNVLQHYAALGRDVVGAQSVNLNPFDAPKDVYSDVLEVVENLRQEDAKRGVEIAKLLEGFVHRKIIKQPIMTSVYGVTKYGARRQIENQLRHIDGFPEELIFEGRSYLADKTFESLHVMFTTNKAIQDYLVTCADIISRIRQQPVQWITPLGWPVLQPYFRSNHVKDKKLPFGSIEFEKPNTVKQKNAFPPNFIHSLDSAHMMLTSIHCLRAGIMFASIHDCFWTHACDVPIMNKICREQFVALHSEPILENIASSLVSNYGYSDAEITACESQEKKNAMEFVNFLLQNIPKQGTFDINKVLESTYFFS